MKFSIVTPSILRPLLKRTCDYIDCQTYADFEHIVTMDKIPATQQDFDLLKSIEHPRRVIIPCITPSVDGGNTPRHKAWAITEAEWIIYCDDDNYLSDPQILADIATAIDTIPEDKKWCLFPIN